jgi:hypothetical protein
VHTPGVALVALQQVLRCIKDTLALEVKRNPPTLSSQRTMSAASDNSNTPVYSGAHDLEKGRAERIERVVTPGGHPADFSQPAIPQQHVSLARRRKASMD